MTTPPEPPTEDIVEYVPRHEAGLNRLVVALVGAVVLGVALVALAVGLYTTTASITSTFRTVVLGPLEFTVSNARPSEGLVLVAIIGIVVVAVVALLLEGIAAVLVATGDAVREAVRDGDLVSRWRTNAFLVAGFGLEPDQGMLRKRIQSQLDASGVHLGKWPIAVQAGATAAPAADCDVGHLIRGAEAISGQQA